MSFYRTVLGIVTGAAFRSTGVQSGTPFYTQRAAASVNMDTAMQLSAVWACARLITECIGSMPICVYKKKSDGSRVRDYEHPLALLFNAKPNRWQTKQEFIESITYQKVLLGNNYSAIQRDSKDKIIGLVPLMSEQMRVILEDSGEVRYEYTETGGVRAFSSKSIWHNKLFGNGIIGLNPLAFARNSVGIGQAAENSVTKIYQNGGKPSGILMIDRTLKPEQREQVKKSFAGLSEGSDDRLFVLEADMKFEKVSLSPQDIELLASRRFQIEDIARFFGVPSVLINDTQNSTVWGSGIQQIVEGFYKLGLRPYLERYEASMKCNLLTVEERQDYDIEFDYEDFIMPNLSERISTGKEGVTGALMTPNEWRKTEKLPPAPGGDKLYMQQQMTPLDQLEKIDRTKSAPPQGSQA